MLPLNFFSQQFLNQPYDVILLAELAAVQALPTSKSSQTLLKIATRPNYKAPDILPAHNFSWEQAE